MEESFILEVAEQIASGSAAPVSGECSYAKPAVVPIAILRNGSDELADCPQLRARNSGDLSAITCRHLFQVGRGCPFVLSGKTCFSGK